MQITEEINLELETCSVSVRYEVCPGCEKAFCYFDCDLSQMESESEEEAMQRIEWNRGLDGISSLLLCLSLTQAIDPSSNAVKEAINDSISALTNEIYH